MFGISSQPLPDGLDYGPDVAGAATAAGFPPCWLYAHAYQETIKVSGWIQSQGKTPATFISFDNGHGLLQLTSSFPRNWDDPGANASFAIVVYLQPAVTYWNTTYGVVGDDLVRCVAAEYNAGRSHAEAGHSQGDVGMFTTHTDGVAYSDLVLRYYHQLAAGQTPSG